MWKTNKKELKATSLLENHYKMLYRWHYPPLKIQKMFTNKCNICWKCQKEVGSYLPQWWTCGKAKRYWRKVHRILEKITTQNVELNPKIFLLNIITTTINKNNKHMIINVCTTARILFAYFWKNPKTPSIPEFINKLYETVEMGKLTNKLKGQKERNEKWNLFYKWLKNSE